MSVGRGKSRGSTPTRRSCPPWGDTVVTDTASVTRHRTNPAGQSGTAECAFMTPTILLVFKYLKAFFVWHGSNDMVSSAGCRWRCWERMWHDFRHRVWTMQQNGSDIVSDWCRSCNRTIHNLVSETGCSYWPFIAMASFLSHSNSNEVIRWQMCVTYILFIFIEMDLNIYWLLIAIVWI